MKAVMLGCVALWAAASISVAPGFAQTGTGPTAPAKAALPAPEKPAGFAQKDLQDLLGLVAGHWNSERHGFFASESGVALTELAPVQHWAISTPDPMRSASLTLLDASGVTRRLSTDWRIGESRAITQHFQLAGPEARAPEVGCVVTWRRFGGQFQGKAEGGECGLVFALPEAEGSTDITMSLTGSEFWIRSQQGAAVQETRLRRARIFTCWSALLRGANHGDDTRGKSDWQWHEGLLVHDQGGEASIVSDETPPRTVRLKLRLADWTYGTRRPSLTLYVHEGDDARAVSYAWADGEAERVGINLRWLQASCTLTPEATLTTTALSATSLDQPPKAK